MQRFNQGLSARFACSVAAALLAGCGVGSADIADDGVFASEAELSARPDGQHPAFVRIRTIDMERVRQWTPVGNGTDANPQYNAQDVLKLDSALQPDVLERYISEDVTRFTSLIPGNPALTWHQFLDASERATACPSYITPRVSPQIYDNQSPAAFFQTTKDLLNVSGLPNAMRRLSLDLWNPFAEAHHWDRDFLVGILDQLHAQGWTEVGLNLCGVPSNPPPPLEHLDDWGHADFVDVCADPAMNWGPSPNLQILDASTSVHRRLLYIDFPHPMDQFNVLAPEDQAGILANIAKGQSTAHYTFVYPVLQLEPPVTYDAPQIDVAKGPYAGKTILGVMKDLIHRYNDIHRTCH